MQEIANGNFTRLNKSACLDLDSPIRNVVIGEKLLQDVGTVQIIEGGKTKTVDAGAQITAAEYVAVKQVLSSGSQQLALDHEGRASGGMVDLNALTFNNQAMKASSLVVPRGVTTYGDFGRGSDFRLSGDLFNYGIVHTYSSDRNAGGGAIYASNITIIKVHRSSGSEKHNSGWRRNHLRRSSVEHR